MSYELTNAEWRAFQAIPDQGHSHRWWVNERIRERLAARDAGVKAAALEDAALLVESLSLTIDDIGYEQAVIAEAIRAEIRHDG